MQLATLGHAAVSITRSGPGQSTEKKGCHVTYTVILYTQGSLYVQIKRLQIHRHGHAVAVDQQTRRQVLPQHLEITEVRLTVRLLMRRALHRGWQGRKNHGRLAALLHHQFVQNQMLCPTGEVIE